MRARERKIFHQAQFIGTQTKRAGDQGSCNRAGVRKARGREEEPSKEVYWNASFRGKRPSAERGVSYREGKKIGGMAGLDCWNGRGIDNKEGRNPNPYKGRERKPCAGKENESKIC